MGSVLLLLLLAVVVIGIPVWLVHSGAQTIRGRMNSRPCPRCGHRVPNGRLDCEACGYEFTA